MERVTGIGGFFFVADDPAGLTQWYAEHLGVDAPPETYDDSSWWQQTGPTVFTGMAAGSDHFPDPAQRWSINFRVADLDAMVAQLRSAGVEVDVDPATYPNGRFAHLRDPEGNPIDLWQPAGTDLRPPAAR